METVLLVIVAALLALFGVAAFREAAAAKKEARELEKAKEEKQKHEAEKLQEAQQTKSEARSGNHSRDLDFMSGKLHDYSKK